jgi:hypothetical protein
MTTRTVTDMIGDTTYHTESTSTFERRNPVTRSQCRTSTQMDRRLPAVNGFSSRR